MMPCIRIVTFLFLTFLLLQLTFYGANAIILSRHRRHDSTIKPQPDSVVNKPLCDIYAGNWVFDETYPLYQSLSCPIIDPEFNCQLYGRPDTNYLKFRWQPNACTLPRFNGIEFLSKMRGKTIMFVGDSLGRNQWQSLICMLGSGFPQLQTQFIRGDPISTFIFLDYGVSVSFFRAPYLVDIDIVGGKRILKLDEISENGNAWRTADVLSFNSGHWWTHKGALQGWDYMSDDGSMYLDMDRLLAFQKGMSTWANWVDQNIDSTRTKVFFQSISPTHYNPIEWNDVASKNCYGQMVPLSGSNYSGPYPDQMPILQGVLKAMRSPTYLLNITTLSELRKDGHPSIYSGDLSPEQRSNPSHADCSHWCLPGLPDTWNQLFYTALFYY